jgi:hypothetical protein
MRPIIARAAKRSSQQPQARRPSRAPARAGRPYPRVNCERPMARPLGKSIRSSLTCSSLNPAIVRPLVKSDNRFHKQEPDAKSLRAEGRTG